MKKIITALLGALISILSFQPVAQAVPIFYEGSIAYNTTVGGTVGPNGWVSSVASEVDFWSFSGIAGHLIALEGRRDQPGSQGLDLAYTLYSGATAADESEYTSFGDFGGLTFLLTRDDTIEVPGPFGDPDLQNFPLPDTGDYTVAIGGFLSTPGGPYDYNLTLRCQNLDGRPCDDGRGDPVIPEPASLFLLSGGLLGLLGIRKKI